MASLHWLVTVCSSGAAPRGGLLFGLFLAGAAGSVVHCAPMCGVFVLGQMSDRMVRLPAHRLCESQRLRNGLLLPYHLGRLSTYALLGALAAASVGAFSQAEWFAPLSAALLVCAAALFLRRALGRGLSAATWLDRVPPVWSRTLGRLTRRIPRGTVPGQALLGLALGFLPCGFLYAALAAAAATGRPWMGAAAMAAFGLGTAPALMLVAVAGQAAGRRWSHVVNVAAPVVMSLNAMLLLVLAWQLVG